MGKARIYQDMMHMIAVWLEQCFVVPQPDHHHPQRIRGHHK